MNNVVNWVGADAILVSDCVHYSWKEALNNQTENALYYEDKVLAELYGLAYTPLLQLTAKFIRAT